MKPSRVMATSVFLLSAVLFTAVASAHSTLSDITDGDEERVTLPVVPQSKLIIHATSGIDKTTGEGTLQSLPLAVFLTLMTPAEVVSWYRQELPEFTVLQSNKGEHAQILERAGEDTRIDGPDTYRIPNIRIQPTDARTATHMEGAKTMLQVYYQPAPEPEETTGGGS